MSVKCAHEVREVNRGLVLKLRHQGYGYQAIADELQISIGQVHLLYKLSVQEAAKLRDELMPLMLEITLQGFDQLEEMILANGRINLEAALKTAILALAEAQGAGDHKAVIAGRTLAQWEIEVDRLEKLSRSTLGMVNEDIDRLCKIRDRRAQYLGVEPAKKVDVEHTFILKASEAQAKLRAKLGMGTGSTGPGTGNMEPPVVDVEPESEESAEVPEDVS